MKLRSNSPIANVVMDPETGTGACLVNATVDIEDDALRTKVENELYNAFDGLAFCLGSEAGTIEAWLEERRKQDESLKEILPRLETILKKHGIPGEKVTIHWQVD